MTQLWQVKHVNLSFRPTALTCKITCATAAYPRPPPTTMPPALRQPGQDAF
jgi:hypothetical protein